VDIGKHATLRDRHIPQELVQLLVVLDGQRDVTRHDARLLVVACGVPGELQNLGAEVLEYGGEIDRGACAHAGGVLAVAEVATDTAHRKLESGLGGGGGGLLLAASSLSFS